MFCNRSDTCTYEVCTLIYRSDTFLLPILPDSFRYNDQLPYHIPRGLHTSCCNSQYNYFQTSRQHTLSNKTRTFTVCVNEWRLGDPILIKSMHNLFYTYLKYMFNMNGHVCMLIITIFLRLPSSHLTPVQPRWQPVQRPVALSHFPGCSQVKLQFPKQLAPYNPTGHSKKKNNILFATFKLRNYSYYH